MDPSSADAITLPQAPLGIVAGFFGGCIGLILVLIIAKGPQTKKGAWIGFAIGFSIRTSGTLYTFGCLVLPALVAKNLCREVRPMLLVSPLVALVTGAAAFVLANHYDYPPAQMAVALLCGALLLAWLVRRE